MFEILESIENNSCFTDLSADELLFVSGGSLSVSGSGIGWAPPSWPNGVPLPF